MLWTKFALLRIVNHGEVSREEVKWAYERYSLVTWKASDRILNAMRNYWFDGLNFEEIAYGLGSVHGMPVTRERIRQIIEKGVRQSWRIYRGFDGYEKS